MKFQIFLKAIMSSSSAFKCSGPGLLTCLPARTQSKALAYSLDRRLFRVASFSVFLISYLADIFILRGEVRSRDFGGGLLVFFLEFILSEIKV